MVSKNSNMIIHHYRNYDSNQRYTTPPGACINTTTIFCCCNHPSHFPLIIRKISLITSSDPLTNNMNSFLFQAPVSMWLIKKELYPLPSIDKAKLYNYYLIISMRWAVSNQQLPLVNETIVRPVEVDKMFLSFAWPRLTESANYCKCQRRSTFLVHGTWSWVNRQQN